MIQTGLSTQFVCEIQNFKELIQHVYGFSLDSMYSSADAMLQKLQVTKAMLRQPGFGAVLNEGVLDDRERAMQKEHVHSKLDAGKYYRLVRPDDGSMLAFQVICKNPERRSYVQRVCFLGKDAA